MAGDLNRKDGDATASVSEEILFHQADGPNTSCFSALELSHQRTSRLRSEILRSQIKECEAEFKKSECFAQDIDDDDNISVCKQDKKWSSRQQSFCTECEKPLSSCIIKCSTCKELLCGTCDLKFHFKRPFHVRELFNNKDLSSRFLLPEEFIGVDGIVKAKAVPVPLFVPSRCINCREHGTFSREAGSKSLAIITKEVVLIFTRRRFVAVNARTALKHQMKYLILHWHHFQHLSPSTSVRKYVECLEEVTKARGGNGIINRTHFSRACGQENLAVHIDGNFKLYRWMNSAQYNSPSLFGNEVVQWCEDRRNHERQINLVKPVAKEKDTCGTSTYATGRAKSLKKKNIDITGTLMGSCRHGIILGATDLEKGESYRAVHFLLTKMPAKFICQDVICHFWKFAHDVGSLIKEYQRITEDSTPSLSRWHGKTHAWYCQALWLGHWKANSAATLGEEQEQGFAYFSSLALKTKRMDRGSRRDSMSSSILYFNAKKNRKIVSTLTKKLKKAWKLAPFLRAKLEEMLNEKKLREDQLPELLQKLQEKAINHQHHLTTSNLPLDYERNHLEGLHMALQRFKKRIEVEAVTAKERMKIRVNLRKTKEDAETLIVTINAALPQILAEFTPQDFDSGIFPWQSLGGTIKDDFELIDVWMLSQRYEEEISETEKEMREYIEGLTTKKKNMNDYDKENDESDDDDVDEGEISDCEIDD
ncbi:hypothetical protein OUZ56_012645 [Daphnia magna]|uniref:C2H2-type domain-containing protein n=2 Tax=Daphnia magna TaxID=35525 RepID=A0ABQ9Z3T3_9CRUS|nr:hypothetical protein OUZ56_012645 [Daphnia magna]